MSWFSFTRRFARATRLSLSRVHTRKHFVREHRVRVISTCKRWVRERGSLRCEPSTVGFFRRTRRMFAVQWVGLQVRCSSAVLFSSRSHRKYFYFHVTQKRVTPTSFDYFWPRLPACRNFAVGSSLSPGSEEVRGKINFTNCSRTRLFVGVHATLNANRKKQKQKTAENWNKSVFLWNSIVFKGQKDLYKNNFLRIKVEEDLKFLLAQITLKYSARSFYFMSSNSTQNDGEEKKILAKLIFLSKLKTPAVAIRILEFSLSTYT